MTNKLLAASILILSLLLCVSCEFPFQSTDKNNDGGRTLTLATWNVQNIFNAVDDGNEYEEYLSDSGWDERSYKARLKNLATVFSYFSPDVVVLNEVENVDVVQDIITKLNDYPNFCLAGEPNGAISIAIISRYPIKNSCIHTVSGTRPILQADIESPNGNIRIFAVHGKSKRDSESASRQTRLSMGQTLSLIAGRDDENLVIIAGDFNEDIDENNIFGDIRYGITDAPIQVSPTYSPSYWYDPFSDPEMSFSCEGTYCYNGTWSHFDHIVCSFSPDWAIEDAQIISKGILLTSDGKPNSYNRALLNGVSDHLPVTLTLTY